jgi:uncharacterized protein YjiS (DUF1127 family)
MHQQFQKGRTTMSMVLKARASPGLSGPATVLPPTAVISATLRKWIARPRQRRDLAELEDHLLRDIGVSRGEALREAAKPFWKG